MGERASEQLADAIADLLMYPPEVEVPENENISRVTCYSMRAPGGNNAWFRQKPSEAVCQVPSPELGEAPRAVFNQYSTSSTPDIGALAVSAVIVKLRNVMLV
ncbi:uncharacterized protein LOC113765701 [Coffea eugenioides]|uniref:uncharacterized protein LOC113765701 n=1 Tax=Coffea eugenioides TaxID=49369 RepID=UPI000F607D98|nr:uncharacterized protein LOC113765701 [Coffea eugenioides]